MYKNIFLNNTSKIRIIKNSKEPLFSWKKLTTHKKVIDLTKHNVGILAGKINDIIVLDIDDKDDGINEFKKYTDLYGEINTLTVKTPNKGFHYYFSYHQNDDTVQHLINDSLINKSKYRNGKGIDIRSNGGYVVGPNSSINGKKYEIINDVLPIEMPEKLALWILEGNDNIKYKKSKISKNPKYENVNSNKYIFDITDEQLIDILDKLDSSYYDEYNKWLIVLTVLKNLDKFDIFDSFSKKTKIKNKYNYDKNLYFWNYNRGLIDINYLIKKINKEQNLKIPLVQKYKLLPTFDIPNNIKSFTFNKKFLEFDNNIFDLYNTFIIQSDPGTGKTTHISKQVKRYIDENLDKDYKLISLVNLKNLAFQQLKNFNDDGLNLISYLDPKKDIYDDHLVICVNSLGILSYLPKEFFKDKILYIDEINSFLSNLTTNNELSNNIKIIYDVLIKLINYSHKVIFTDAYINQSVFDFVKNRDDKTKIFINNEHKKYQNIDAVRVKDENLFVQKLLDNIKNNKYFLFGCDSCKIVTDLYNKCINDNPDKKNNFLLITSEHKFKLTNANEQFKNKWVFYSPSITTGVDFSIDVKQDHFIYATGNSINPILIYQQSTRNRNIDKLYYYFNSKEHNFFFNSIDDVIAYYKNILNANDVINNICIQYDKNDESYINENTFFNLFCYNEYINDCFNTNKYIHYEQILKDKGFNLISEGDFNTLSKQIRKEIKELEVNDNIINDYINDTNDNKKIDVKYDQIKKQIDYFKLEDNELIKYNGILTDKFEREHFFNFIKLLQNDDKIDLNNLFLNNTSFNVKHISTIDNKIKIIKYLYDKHKIKYLSLDKFNTIEKIEISNELYKLIKLIFRTTKSKPTTNYELNIMMHGILKNIVGNLDIIETHKTTKDKITLHFYTWKYDKCSFYFDLYKHYTSDIDICIFYTTSNEKCVEEG